MARHAARVLAALVRATDDDVLYLLSFELAAGKHRLDRARKQVVGADLGKAAGITTKRGALTIVNIGVEHVRSFVVDRSGFGGENGDAETGAAREPDVGTVARIAVNAIHRGQHAVDAFDTENVGEPERPVRVIESQGDGRVDVGGGA